MSTQKEKSLHFIMTTVFIISIVAAVIGHYTIDNGVEDLRMRIAAFLGSAIMYFTYYFFK